MYAQAHMGACAGFVLFARVINCERWLQAFSQSNYCGFLWNLSAWRRTAFDLEQNRLF